MFRKEVIVIVALLFPFLSLAQGSGEKKALRLIEKQRYNSAYIQLKRSLWRDPSSTAALYVMGHYFRVPQNPDFQLDSAYVYAQKAVEAWPALNAKARHRLKRFPVDSLSLLQLRKEIEGFAFEQAEKLNTEEGYVKFISSYPLADQQAGAKGLLEKVAYEKAVTANTHAAFLDYITRYPGSRYRNEAQQKYDRLLFEHSTGTKTLEAYTAYLKENPQSPYRQEVEKNIFEISTADGSSTSFENFIRTFPDNSFTSRASSILEYLLSEDQRSDSTATELSKHPETDSSFLVPFLQKGKFGLMDPRGKEVVTAQCDELDKNYICGNILDDVLILGDQVVSSRGSVLYMGAVLSIDDLGHGFVLLEREDGYIVLHKSGFAIGEQPVEDAKVLQGKLLALKKNGLWGLFTLSGRQLLNYEFQDVSTIGNVFILKINDKYTLSNLSSLAGIANDQKGKFSDAYDDVRKSFGDNIWIKVGDFEGVLDQHLQILIQADTHQLSPAYFGAIAKSARGFSTFNQQGLESEHFIQLNIVKPWVSAKTQSGWILYDPVQRVPKSVAYDSIVVNGPFAIGMKKDLIDIHLHKKNAGVITMLPPDKVELLPAQDSVSYLMLETKKKQSVFDQSGQKLFTIGFDKIQAAGHGFFVVSKKDKKGLVDLKGKLVLPVEYDAIGSAQNGHISLLKALKFGLYDYRNNKLIRPEYEKNMVSYNSKMFTVFKNGLVGFVDASNKPVTKVEFLEVLPWTDSVAFVRSSDGWSMLNLFEKNISADKITSFKVIRDTPEEKLLIIHQNNQVGVLSNRKGIVIPVKFSDIINVGSPQMPVYFTEKHVQEAAIFVVIYYDHAGNLIRREVYEQDDYERIYCNH